MDKSEFYISEHARAKARILPPKSVLVTCIGIIGKVAINNVECAFNQQINAIIPDDSKCLTEYLAYAIQNKQAEMQDIANAPVVPILNKTQFSDIEIKLPSLTEQAEIIGKLNAVTKLIALRKEQLAKLDQLVKSRFIELFGDPIDNTMGLKMLPLGEACYLKAGITTSADAIHEHSADYPIPCYGGNGVRGYVEEATQRGSYPIIGRQGALCGNVQLATGEFHATEHAVLVTPLIDTNVIWLFHLLKLMDLYRFHTGAAQPGLAVKTLNTVDIPIADISDQNKFAAFVEQTDKSKLVIQQSLDKLELLKESLMQEYFG